MTSALMLGALLALSGCDDHHVVPVVPVRNVPHGRERVNSPTIPATGKTREETEPFPKIPSTPSTIITVPDTHSLRVPPGPGTSTRNTGTAGAASIPSRPVVVTPHVPLVTNPVIAERGAACNAIWPLLGADDALPADAGADVHTAIVAELRFQGRFGGFQAAWIGMCGPELIGIVDANDGDTHVSLLKPLITMATNLNVPTGQELQFAQDSGLAGICLIYSEAIQALMVAELGKDWDDIPRDAAGLAREEFERAFAANLHRYCPGIFVGDHRKAKAAVVLHIMHRIKTGARRTGGVPLDINVARDVAFRGMVGQLNQNQNNVRAGVERAIFTGEAGSGAGVIREWFAAATTDMVGPDTGVFEASEEVPSRFGMKADQTGVTVPGTYRGIGRFLAFSLLQRQPLGLDFGLPFWAKLMGLPVTLEAFADFDPVKYRGFNYYLDMDADALAEAGLELNEEDVTPDNVQAYVANELANLIPRVLDPLFAEMRQGFFEIIPHEKIAGFVSPTELGWLIFGETDIDVDELIAHLNVEDYGPNDPVILQLEQILREMTQVELVQFFRFVTARPGLPVGGFAAILPPIQIVRATGLVDTPGAMRFPRSQTCYNQFQLPTYANVEIMRDRIRTAITAESVIDLH